MRFEYPIDSNTNFLKGASNSMGFYPLGIYNNWHGGIHIERTSSAIQAIADGHIIAYRLPLQSIKTEKENKKYSYSNGFIIIRHKYTSPKGQSLQFYSLYNHLLPKEEYDQTVNKIPSCYQSSEQEVKAGKKTKTGIRIWKNNSKTMAESCFLPYGTIVTPDNNKKGTGGEFKEDEVYKWVEVKDLKGNLTAEGYINMKDECVTHINSGKYRVKYTGANSQDENLEIWKSDKFEELLCLLAPGSKVKIIKYNNKLAEVSVEGQTGYVKNPDLYLQSTWSSQIKTDGICKCIIPVKAGETIGYAGPYGYFAAQEYRTAHIEVFTDDKENLEKFLNNKCQEGKKAFIKLPDQVGPLKYKFLSGTEVKIQDDNGGKGTYVKICIGEVHVKVNRKSDLGVYDLEKKTYTFNDNFDNLNNKLQSLLFKKGTVTLIREPNKELITKNDPEVLGGNEREVSYAGPLCGKLFWIDRKELTVDDKKQYMIGARNISAPEIKTVDLYLEKPAESEEDKNKQTAPKEHIIEIGKLQEIIQSESPDIRWYYVSLETEDIEGQKCTRKGYLKKDPQTEFSAFEWGKFGFRIFGEQEDKDRYLYDLTPQPENTLTGYVQSLVDRENKNGILEYREFKAVMKDPARVNQLSRMVCYHHNEWGYDNNLPKLMKEFEERYDSLINDEKEQKYKDQLRQQKEQQLSELEQKIKDLCFWKNVAGKYELHLTREKKSSINPEYSEQLKASVFPKFGTEISDNNGHPEMTVTEKYTETFNFPSNPHVFHLHPIAFVEQMKKMESLVINTYNIDIDTRKIKRSDLNTNLNIYYYNIFNKGLLIQTYRLIQDTNGEKQFLEFPELGINWDRYGVRDKDGDNWINKDVAAYFLGFLHELYIKYPNEIIYYDDISGYEGKNIGHKSHRKGEDIDIRYPGTSKYVKFWYESALYDKEKKDDSELVKMLENILNLASGWNFTKNFVFKSGITNAAYAIQHEHHYHLGCRNYEIK